jgi:glucose/arabinose dehydrogenase
MIILQLLLGFIGLVHCIPSGFVAEAITDIKSITGAFAPNPRKDGKPMLLLSSKFGQIFVLEDPDNSDDNFVVADFESQMCRNGERGLLSIRPHPDFILNRFIYMFYTRLRAGCVESATDGPWNRLSRFTMNETTLMIDYSTEVVLLETSPTLRNFHNGGNIAFGNDGKMEELSILQFHKI